jgi:glycosyltransferase involved in cell wall biosynthesis
MISFIVACFNEQENIIKTIKQIEKSCKKLNLNKYEIIVVDDASKDISSSLVNEYKKKNNKRILLLRSKKNLGYGASVKIGAYKSTKEYIIWVPGDNSHKASEIYKIIKHIEVSDIVSTYYINSNARNFYRRLFTSFYTPVLNFFFNQSIPYYNGVTIIKKKLFLDCKIKTNSHSFQVEMWSRIFLLKEIKFKFIPTLLQDRTKGATAFKFINSIKVIYNTVKVIFLFLVKKYIL